jgi:hypothetical protein
VACPIRDAEGTTMIAKIGKKTPTFEIHEAPTHWRKTLKSWGLFFLCVFVVSLLSGIIVGLLQGVIYG